jgi:hypothetical protein
LRAQSDAAWYRAITGTDPPKYKPRLDDMNHALRPFAEEMKASEQK